MSQGRERYIFIHENNRLLTDSPWGHNESFAQKYQLLLMFLFANLVVILRENTSYPTHATILIMTLLATIVLMAFLDTLFLTGYFFYGAGITAVTSVAILADYSFTSILFAICIGAFVGDMVNYTAGRFFSHNPKVQHVIGKTKEVKLLDKFMHHTDDTLLRKTFLASLFRLLAVLRPVNAILLAVSTRNSVRNFFALAVAVVLWSTAWLLVISGIMSTFF